ncbi:hypothetical protein Sipo8835_14850 [Streptomyces ipomoeae]|uniref:Uncharacterized protein n=1 Tax=Streptomyces ipomoeae TaxID=103232 RepID=A0AAE8W2V4_9ACTN|nr:hypothetical protein Sipo7851_44975 [Streptomyces ipomoeae]TQE34692.1 hypothetical protein Sipo8835_14850 [Streptomyces ipomoeae]
MTDTGLSCHTCGPGAVHLRRHFPGGDSPHHQGDTDRDGGVAGLGGAALRSRISTDHGTCGSNRFPAGVSFPLCAHEDRASR